MAFDWKSIVKTIAPALGTALGGPMAGIATKFIADKFLGNPEATEKEIAEAVFSATPDQLLKLKELDNSFNLEMKRLDVDVYNIDYLDRDSARKRQMAVKDNTPAILAYLSLSFLAAVTFVFSSNGWQEGEINIWFNIFTLSMIAFTYYFGSSNKNKIDPHIQTRK